MGTLQDGDPQSFAQAEIRSHQSLLRDLARAVRRVCPRSLVQDAEDLVQESFIRLMRARKLDGQSTLSAAYLKKVAYSAVIDELRRRRREPAADLASDRIDIADAADQMKEDAPDTALRDAMEVSLQRLQPDRRRALTLHLLGYSVPEVAAMLECNTKRADNLVHRGLAQLRQFLGELGLRP
ncbi:MAG TPA: RNA polymerase sigma factor [Steroidobacteraceae bacterium]|nr:RNA polymerase sigma factor [Steroidobacteraceae bacterium]